MKSITVPIPEGAEVSDEKALQMYRPVQGNVLIKRHKTSGMTKGGIALPGTNRRNGRGTVMSLPDVMVTAKGVEVPIDWLEVGDVVLFSEYDVTEVVEKGEHVLVKATNIYCIIDGDEFE
jgi:co-chaperonin GroES (HSP10)